MVPESISLPMIIAAASFGSAAATAAADATTVVEASLVTKLGCCLALLPVKVCAVGRHCGAAVAG